LSQVGHLRGKAASLIAVRYSSGGLISPCGPDYDGGVPGFFIIFGSPRSGTTLLAQCLSNHSDVVIPYETDFLIPSALIFNRIKDAATGKRLIAELIVSTNDFRSLAVYLTKNEIQSLVLESDYNFQTIVHNIYSAIAKRVNKSVAGDKSPNDLHNVDSLLQAGLLEEKTKAIHIVRDIRDVTESLIRMNWAPGLENNFPRYWCANNLFLYTVLSGEPNYFFLRYEDFVTDPDGYLRKLCAFLGISFEVSMLDTSAFHQRYKSMPAHSNLYEAISNRSVGKWKSALTTEQVRMIESQAREALLKFDYSD
jgi:hypothetical protein